MARKVIKLVLDARQAQRVAKGFEKQLSGINRSTKRLSGSFGRLEGLLALTFSVQGLKTIASYSDQFKLLESRIKTFRREGESIASIQGRILDITKANGLELNTTVDAYTKFSNGLKQSNLSSQQILDTLEATTSAFRIFGVAGAQAESAILQLSQGLQKGNLDGEEFKAVSENASILLDIFAKEAGVARGSLKDFASQGKLTSEIIVKGLLKNLDDLNRQASEVPLTLGQITTNLKTRFAQGIENVEKLTGAFSLLGKGITVVSNNLDILASVLIALSTLYIPRLIGTLKTLKFVLLTSNPWTALATVAVGAVSYIIFNWEKVSVFFKNLWADISYLAEIAFLKIEKTVLSSRIKIANALEGGLGKVSSFFGGSGKIELFDQSSLDASRKKIDLISARLAELSKNSPKKIEIQSNGPKVNSRSSDVSIGDIKTREDKISPKVLNINKNELDAKRLQAYNDQLRKINENLDNGKLNANQYAAEVSSLKVKFDDLGNTSQRVTNGVSDGLKQYTASISNLSQNISQGIQNTLKGLEDQLVGFVTKGKIEFKQFTNAILADLARIVIRQTITKNIASGISGAIASANGNVFSGGNVQAFATGGVVNSPTYFPMTGSKQGLMGEAGPEAIMPLSRIGNKLGVKSTPSNVNVNIINEGGGEVETTERNTSDGKVIDVLIKNAVKSGFSQGSFDKELRTNYGLNRKGQI